MGRKTVFNKALKLMGNRFQISAVAKNEAWANERIDAAIGEIQRIEKLLTTFSNDSETSLINENAGLAPVKVSRETFELIERSTRISRVTQGAFDITYGSVDKSLWNFDTNMKSLPDKETARKRVGLINYRNIVLDDENATVFLKKKGMRIGFGGIGKGYAAEKAKQVMQEMGVESGIVNASGDLTCWGHQSNGKPWTIGIVNPNAVGQVFSCMDVTNMAIATSGNYEKYIMINGKKYSHTIDPRTGLPVTGIKSVTIITPNAEISDAMATPVMIMGIEAGINMVNQIKDMEAILIDDQDKIYTSDNIRFSLNAIL
ncbi:MAG: FAD:protein FMN transferase [Bacteroidota bacterium]|nr:FAD:protein FMN transferase [Bacteroidota bacterium]MDP4251453.1 FAD:protein FMN transferase [Bacteroidota bacterium]